MDKYQVHCMDFYDIESGEEVGEGHEVAYKAKDVADLARRSLKFIKEIVEMDWVYRDKENLALIAELEKIAGK